MKAKTKFICAKNHDCLTCPERTIENRQSIQCPTTLKEKTEMSSLKQKIICLVGSTKPEWRQKYREVLEKLTLMGNAVFTVVWFRGDFKGDFEARRELMEQVHYLKIRTSDAVVCISKEAIGDHTQMEMAYARSIGKPVYFAEDLK